MNQNNQRKRMKHKLKVIWRILRDRQVVVITESYGRMYYDWDTMSEDITCGAIAGSVSTMSGNIYRITNHPL